jgi:hypothetical protein
MARSKNIFAVAFGEECANIGYPHCVENQSRGVMMPNTRRPHSPSNQISQYCILYGRRVCLIVDQIGQLHKLAFFEYSIPLHKPNLVTPSSNPPQKPSSRSCCHLGGFTGPHPHSVVSKPCLSPSILSHHPTIFFSDRAAEHQPPSSPFSPQPHHQQMVSSITTKPPCLHDITQ